MNAIYLFENLSVLHLMIAILGCNLVLQVNHQPLTDTTKVGGSVYHCDSRFSF